MNQHKLLWLDIIDFAGMTIIGIYILLSSIFVSGFAVLHLTLPNGLPFFVGEACLLSGLTLLMIKLNISKGWQYWHWFWVIYALWILWATWCGIQNGTLLAFRHAALFYYPFFALLGYSFYNRRILISHLVFWSMLVILVLFLSGQLIAPYYCFSCVVLAIVLSLRLQSRIVRWAMIGFLILWYLQFMFCGSRSHLVGSLAGVIFIGTVLTFVILQWKLRYRLIVFAVLILSVGLGVKHFSDPNSVKSLTMPLELKQKYHQYQDFIDANKASYGASSLSVKLYDDNVQDRKARSRDIHFLHKNYGVLTQQIILSNTDQNCQPNLSVIDSGKNQAGVIKFKHFKSINRCCSKKIVDASHAPRSLGNVYGNIMFRWFIWKDMWDDLVQAHSLWGVGFGKPQRSKSLEILNWGSTEWRRDGWIAPHNSFFHMIYRGGIIGVLIIIGIVWIFAHLLKIFIAKRSFSGILLLSILIYWLAMANFLVILELPYNAVLFWMIFGMIYAYAKKEGDYEIR